MITGREQFEGRSSLETLMQWIVQPAPWDTKECILVENLGLKDMLGIPKDQKRAMPVSLLHNEGFIEYATASFNKQQKKMTLDPTAKEALAVFGRLQRLEDIESGVALTVIPLPDQATQKWVSLDDIRRAYERDGAKMPDAAKLILGSFGQLMTAYKAGNAPDFTTACVNFDQILREVGAKDYPDPGKITLEVQYNSLAPFGWAWKLDLVAAILVGLSFMFRNPKFVRLCYRPGLLIFISAVGFSLYGFILRCVIAGRPPVSNMYESLIWVTFGMSVFALIFESIYKVRYFVLASSILATAGFVLADNVPTVLDSSIQPLEPVLRSNYWLTIHVLTITLSYAAFLLSLGIGHVCLWFLWFRGNDKERVQRFTRLLYRVVQVGVVLLAAGTILGGVWANYSWGRFWGWDPKETWALIALLGYVAILHGRLSGWLKDAGFTIGVVSAFLGVLMAWYGVNFVLGVGLHSYGFSKGGLPYVCAFVAAEIILVTMVGLKVKAGSTQAKS
jgi:cytochrome c-type biogenesis protein CcsB